MSIYTNKISLVVTATVSSILISLLLIVNTYAADIYVYKTPYYQISLPTNWEVRKSDYDMQSVDIINKHNSKDSIRIIRVKARNKTDITDFDDQLKGGYTDEMIVEGLTPYCTNIRKVIKHGYGNVMNISNYKAYTGLYACNYNGENIYTVAACISGKDGGYTIIGGSNGEKSLNVLIKTIKTFKLLK